MRRVAVAILLTFTTTCGAAGGGPAVPATGPRDCTAATFPFPEPAVALSETDAAPRQLHIGDLVEVALRGDAAHRWEPITLGGDALVARPDPAAAATVGTQLGEFCAARPGTAGLSSTDGSRRWSVTLEVVR